MKELFTKVFVQLDNIFMSSVAKAFLKLYMIKTWFKETLYKSNQPQDGALKIMKNIFDND